MSYKNNTEYFRIIVETNYNHMSKQTKNSRIYHKVKSLDKIVNIEFSETIETDEWTVRNKYESECEHAIHDDFKNALEALKGHLIIINEEYEGKDYDNIPDDVLDKFRVTGFTTFGENMNEGIIITGTRQLAVGGIRNSVSPRIIFENYQAYPAMGELFHAVEMVRKEAHEYLNGKVGQGLQWQISFERKMGIEPEKESPTIKEKPKRKSRKKQEL